MCSSDLPVDIPWHLGTKLRVWLGNDLSRLTYVGGQVDPNELFALSRLVRPGMTFVDAGANEGLYSVFAGSLVGPSGKVIAIEPSARELQRLRENIELNGFEQRVQVVETALAEKDGEGTLRVAGYGHEGHNTLGDFIYDSGRLSEDTVPLRSLDSLVEQFGWDRIDCIKLEIGRAHV